MSNAPGCPRTRFLKGGGYPTPPRNLQIPTFSWVTRHSFDSHAKPTLTN